MKAPSILLVDDGELDAIQALLGRMNVDWVRCAEPDATLELERPRDLIISSGPRTAQMPQLRGDTSPIWICLYDRHFLQLREQLAGLGVHYLVSQELPERTFGLFLRQLLHRGTDRRRVRRIPVRCEVQVDVGVERRKAVMIELSPDGCVFTCDEEVPAERRVVVRLTAESLNGADELELRGSIVRVMGISGRDDQREVAHAFRFGSLDAETMAGLQRALCGDSLESEVTPLGCEPPRAAAAEHGPAGDGEAHELVVDTSAAAARPDRGERRGATRRRYTGGVDAVHWEGEGEPWLMFGYDLSMSGMRLQATLPCEVGSDVTLGLCGGSREEPVLVDATVVWREGDEVGVRFGALDAVARQGLRALLEGKPSIERLTGRPGSLCVAELIDS